MDFTSLLRPDLLALRPYTPIVPFEVLSARLGRDPRDIVKLDANENPYGPSPKARAALANLQFPHIYPDPDNTALRAALAKHLGLPVENLFAGSGSDELIDLIMRAFLRPGEAILDCPPTFGMFVFDAAVNAARVIAIPRRPDFSIDVEAVTSLWEFPSPSGTIAPAAQRSGGGGRGEGERPKLLFLASPNNPTGNVLSDDDLRRLLALPLVIVLDEAYIEFHGADKSRLPWVLEHDNLIVLRTFSKRAGLAGLRVGYGAFPAWLMPHLWKIKQPYNVNVAASAAASASLEDAEYMEHVVHLLAAERERLMRLLTDVPCLRPYPSRANFILCRVVGRDAKELQLALEREGILVRHFNKPGLTDCLRISVGKPEHTEALLEALRRI
jgi:histidinol-phosphate aminotransferase